MKKAALIISVVIIAVVCAMIRTEVSPQRVDCEELSNLIHDALSSSSNAEAALQLADFYRFRLNDPLAGYRWLEEAASRGSPDAKKI